ncbi:hypothetical protein ACIQU6_08330 [Streptomyces sp. NPDC090442]|uniref:hypothetical protein n=1 Tax=Streptomyces sp. NPDC090442 TaxID=3365962 RepID=UPI003808B236
MKRAIDAERADDGPPGVQTRLVMIGGLAGAALLVASLAISLGGSMDVGVPQMPKLPSMPTSFPTSLPTSFPTSFPTPPTSLPSIPPGSLPTGLPTNMPTDLPTGLPTNLPTDLPTNLPSLPPLPTDLPGLHGKPGGES